MGNIYKQRPVKVTLLLLNPTFTVYAESLKATAINNYLLVILVKQYISAKTYFIS